MRSTLRNWLGLTTALAIAPYALAQPAMPRDEGLQLLQKAALAAERMSYGGVFVYRSANKSETTRILHLAEANRRLERLETLEGSLREVLAENDEVKCILPESRLVVIEQRANRRSFPALFPSRLGQLGEFYTIRHEGAARIAGHEGRKLVLEPRDGWRYGHRFWLERDTGLLLKAEVVGAGNEVLESLAFTELRLGRPEKQELRSVYAENAMSREGAWQIRQSRTRELREDTPWIVRVDVPGFRRQAAMVRTVSDSHGATREMLHWIYSDGLAAFSVFISPLPTSSEQAAPAAVDAMGALSLARRIVNGHQVVVMGEVPPHTVRLVADSIEARP